MPIISGLSPEPIFPTALITAIATARALKLMVLSGVVQNGRS